MGTERFLARLRDDSEFGQVVSAAEKKWRPYAASIAVVVAASVATFFCLSGRFDDRLEEHVYEARVRGGGIELMDEIGPDHDLYEAMIAVVGRSGRSTKAEEWMRPGLTHKIASVRRAAIQWYPRVGSIHHPDYASALKSLTGG